MKSIADALAGFKKSYGDKVGSFGGSMHDVARVPSGIFALDLGMGGGFPQGRVSIIYGAESSGKTNCTLRTIAMHQILYPKLSCVFVDLEHSYNRVWAAELGVDVDKLLVLSPDFAEQAGDMVASLLEAEDCGLIVLDSLAAMLSSKMAEKSLEDAHMAGASQIMSRMLDKIVLGAWQAEKSGRTPPTILLINQVRCIHEDSWLWADTGYVKIKDIQVGQLIATPYGMQPVLDKYDSGTISGFEITPKYRPRLTIAGTHQQTVLSQSGYLYEEFGDQLKIGDWLAYPTNAPTASKTTDYISPKLAELLGMYFADGSCTLSGNRGGKPGTYCVQWTEVSDERRELVAEALTAVFDSSDIKVCSNNCYVRVGGKFAVTTMTKLGVGGNGKDKIVPSTILEGSELLVKHFLRGASLDTHKLGEKGFIWTFESERQAETVAILLLRFGIHADLRSGRSSDRTYLHVSSSDAILFSEVIGFAESSKQNQIKIATATIGARGKFDVVPREMAVRIMQIASQARGVCSFPHYSALNQVRHHPHLNASRVRLLEFCSAAIKSGITSLIADEMLLASHRFSPIEDIRAVNFKAVDIEVPFGRFYANGTMTHNTKIGIVYGNPLTLPGATKQKFVASIIVRVSGKNVMDNKISKVMPVFKETSFVIEKWKHPIVATNGAFAMVTVAHKGLSVGECDDFSTVASLLKGNGSLHKHEKTGWLLNGHHYPTLEAVRDRFYTDKPYALKIKADLILSAMKDGALPTDEEEAV